MEKEKRFSLRAFEELLTTQLCLWLHDESEQQLCVGSFTAQ